ncbi:Homocysteine S-methyltransferase [Gymnopus androsaceus JB14]|uniref:Homocysteine S-methyltransferase n=1 Tax=Gymnopus androsaceus JB14 TaxID=1447944 RepID=A0A6A4I0Z3_9AGAR|nr:Homocysteine S-methyltransferase [Gymnopus androsaceus JB14]
MANQFKFFNSQTVVLDGGFGTSLEQLFQLDISNTPLWSAKAVIDHSDVVIKTHLAFLRAGAEVISTSTYQCSYSTFENAGYSAENARRIICRSVELASQARQIFREEQLENEVPPRDVRIALSLGPFGASLKPAQEFDGFYPPPFGPKASGIHPRLAQFHFERLLIVFEEEAAWNSIDCLAFETVPLTREIKAIRQAVGLLNDRIAAAESTGRSSDSTTKPWWISMVFPGGIYPETTKDGSSRMSIQDVVSAAVQDQSLNYPLEYLPRLVSQLEEALPLNDSPKPWLVLYPNGGDAYDPITQKWVESGTQSSDKKWAKALKASSIPSDKWAGVILGGCCRTTPAHIQCLKQDIIAPEMKR